MNTQEILQKTLDQMDLEFTGKYFAKIARKNGLSDAQIIANIGTNFLKRNCSIPRHSWWRKDSVMPLLTSENKEILRSIIDVDYCIQYLKDRGYKIMKVEYVEV